jgi:HAE1 family hydrophobic/amphiphilic exporter-1
MDVPIKQLVNVKEGKTSDTVTRRDGRYSVQVSGKVKEDDISKASMNLQKRLDQIHHPSSVDISMGGVTEDVKDSFTKLGLAMAAAIAIVYLVLVITFGQGWAPFVILFSLPFAIIGALVALFIAGQTISVSTMIGALMLIGIVVTNAIVLIDRVIHKEREGLSTREALLEAGATRIRPILMTAIATIGALIPLAIGMEGSGLISKDLGVTVIGGLTSSTLLTLLIVPIVYEWMSKLRRKRFFKRKKSVTSEQIDHA